MLFDSLLATFRIQIFVPDIKVLIELSHRVTSLPDLDRIQNTKAGDLLV